MKTETVTVEIPTDGSIAPCPHCGSITVDLDGNPKPCAWEDCPGKCRAPHPSPHYRVIDGQGEDITASRWNCTKVKEHKGPHRVNGYDFE